MTLHRLRQIAFWGDYGKTLASGPGVQRDEKTGLLLITRVGPFVPPMIFTREILAGHIVLVTQAFRERLENAGFGELGFKPTIKKHIVPVPWETWDRQKRLPPIMPDSGEPEEYLLGQKHSEECAARMEDIWEFNAPVVPCEVQKSERLRAFHRRWHVTAPKGEHKGLFRPPGVAHVLFIDDARRRWFEQEGEGWIDFDEVTVV